MSLNISVSNNAMFYITSFLAIGSFLAAWTLGFKSIEKDFCHAQNSHLMLLKNTSSMASSHSKPSFYTFQLRNGCYGLMTSKENITNYRSLHYDSFKLETQLDGAL